MTIGLFFGSFNPIHNGHLNIAREVLKKTEIDSIWMVLSPRSPDKEEVLDKKDRYELMRLALMSETKINISKVEFNLKTPNYTYLTLLELSKKHPNYNFIILMGEDNYKNINDWRESNYIINNFKILVYPRESTLKNENFLTGKLYDISSSMIRRKVAKNEDISSLVPLNVMKEIEKKSYYSR
tara:strand:+ start:2079 stop:2627 length:549 start_codon:yes stop_codon:yes gene_type:complete